MLTTLIEAVLRIAWSTNSRKVDKSNMQICEYPNYTRGEVMLYTMASDGSNPRETVRWSEGGLEAANGG